MRSLVLATVARGVLPVTALFALYLLLRGHDEPGGGFIAGLVTAAAIVLQGIAFGVEDTRRLVAPVVRPAIGAGLTIATLTGFVALFYGDPFMTHYHTKLGLVGRRGYLHLNTALFFDIGVYLAVVGVAATLLGVFVTASAPDAPDRPEGK